MGQLIKHISLVSLSLFFVACSLDGEFTTSTVHSHPPKSPRFDFDNFEVGQVFHYRSFEGENYYDFDNNEFNYTHDTLEVEILEVRDSSVLVSEKLISESENYEEFLIVNEWRLGNNQLEIELKEGEFVINSHLFMNGGVHGENLVLPLDDLDVELTEIVGWKTSWLCECNHELYAEEFQLFNTYYPRLNIVMRNIEMVSDGSGKTFYYNRSQGVIRVTKQGQFGGLGWDRIYF